MHTYYLSFPDDKEKFTFYSIKTLTHNTSNEKQVFVTY